MKKQNSWVCGNVKVTATLEFPEGTPEWVAALATEGTTQICQRKPSSAWEKAESVMLGLWPTAEAGKEPKRPKGFERNSIPFDEASAARLVLQFKAAMPGGTVVLFETEQHTGEKANASVMAERLLAQATAPMLVVLGITPEDTEEERLAKAKAFLATLRK